MAEPNPTEVSPWYLRNINQALALDEASGNVYVRTGITGDVYITGPVTIPGTITVNSSPEDPVHVHLDEVGTSGILTTPNLPISIQDAAGNENDASHPVYVTAALSGDASVSVNGFEDGLVDAFGRLRVSNPVTLFDTQARYYDHSQYSSSTTGGGAVVYQASSSSFLLNVGTASGDSVLRETVRVFPYQPGKSLLVYQSFCMSTPKANLRQRVGYFGADNGIFFEVDGTTFNMVIRSSSSGVIVEDRIPQAQWNTNSMSNSIGVNPSGITLNPALDQIWFCDIEWLGVGSVRVGFVINGQYITCHTFHHANTASTLTANNTTTYMTTATLPLRLEITNTGITGSASTLRQICSSVISEGGFQLSGSGNPRAASHLIGNPVTLPNDVSFKPVIAIRLKPTMLDAVVIPMNYSLVPVQQSIFQFRIYKYAVTSGGTWVDSAADSAVQYNLSPTALVSGTIVEQSFINSTNQSSSAPTQEAFNFTYQLEREPFTGTPYEYVIMMATTGNSQTVYASIEWQEIT